MVDEKVAVELGEEEKTAVRGYQKMVERGKSSLGNLRQQYLIAERRLLDELLKAESDYLSHLKVLASNRGVDTEQENWLFDPVDLAFRKKS